MEPYEAPELAGKALNLLSFGGQSQAGVEGQGSGAWVQGFGMTG